MSDDTTSSDTLERLEEAEQLKLSGRYAEALVILETLLMEDPQNVPALEEVADNELSLERYERARAAAQQAVEIDVESYTGHYILGFLKSIDRDWNDAVELLRKANAMRPNNAEILRCLGWALFSKGERAQGIVTLERSLNLDTENPLTLCDLGVAYLQTGNIVKAKALFERAIELDPENPKALECMKVIGNAHNRQHAA
ncbi:tetratricopeptide repeat protein [Candidatus Peregrinibacteria bacterium]|nr:tetratricopeptide repeat protein [Candidatus Peregrinibacteria bacterium]